MAVDGELTSFEKWWGDRFDLFERHGYRLRPRYRPGWVPSWKKTVGLRQVDCEDSVPKAIGPLLDATRVMDGVCVMIKRVKAGSEEAVISQMLSSPSRRQDPHNHAVPILDYFVEGGDDSQEAFLVMPILRPFDDPTFSTVNEVLDFVRQMLQGLAHLHELNVAHRDCYVGNIMMDATDIIPGGFHPQRWDRTPDSSRKIKPLRRRDAKQPVRYYFIDFGISSWFRESDSEGDPLNEDRKPPNKSVRRLVRGNECQDKSPPELGARKPYDPFLLDICILGNVFNRAFIDKYSNLSFLAPLANRMTQTDPKDRPTEQDALEFFEKLVLRQSSIARRWRLRPWEEKPIPAAIRDVQAAALEVKYHFQQITSYVFGSTRRKKVE